MDTTTNDVTVPAAEGEPVDGTAEPDPVTTDAPPFPAVFDGPPFTMTGDPDVPINTLGQDVPPPPITPVAPPTRDPGQHRDDVTLSLLTALVSLTLWIHDGARNDQASADARTAIAAAKAILAP